MGASAFDQSTTAASNSDIGGVNQAEGCAPSTVNNATRALAAQMKGALIGVTASGTDTYVATLAPAPDALTDGMTVHIRFTNSNATTTPTLNINSLGAETIVKNGSAALVAGDIPAGHEGELRYNGTNWVLLNPKHGVVSVADATNGGVTVTNGTSAATLALNVADLSSATPTQSSTIAFEAGSGTKKAAIAGSSTSLVGIAAATQAQMEAESSVETIVMPSRVKYHPGVAKAWIQFDGSAGTIGTGSASYNMDAVTDNGAGDYTINFTTDFSSANYCMASSLTAGASGAAVWQAGLKNGTSPASGSITISTHANNGANADVSFICLTFFGDQ